MRMKHKPGEGDWVPFDIILSFDDEEETEEIYTLLENHDDIRVQKIGSYIEAASDSRGEQNKPETI